MSKDLTQGSIIKSLLILSVPIILANIFQSLYNLIDAYWVGRLGSEAFASVSISIPVIFFMASFLIGFEIAGSSLIAQFHGRKDSKNVNHVTTQVISLMFVIAFFLAIIGFFITPQIVSIFNLEQIVAEGAIGYLQISFISLFFVFPYYFFQGFHRGIGEVKMPMLIVFFTLVLNFILDPLFIFGFGPIPALGVTGAALVTLFAQGLSGVIGIYLMIKGNYGIKFNLKEIFPLDFGLMKKVIKLAVPIIIQFSSNSLSLIVIMVLVSGFGTVITSAHGIVTSIFNFILIPALGLSHAAFSIIGQNLGAKKVERAVSTAKKSLLIIFVMLTIIGAGLFMFANGTMDFFIPGEQNVIDIGTEFIHVNVIFLGFYGIIMVLNSTFNASGNNKYSMLLSILSYWVFRLPLAYILSNYTDLGYLGIWVGTVISIFLTSILGIILFYKSNWQNKELI